ncbi:MULTISPECIES: bifunctional riboflavin kinase/FAD synthetase [unclassified Commensalibacter]|uniref:bifunctional riboflavin kinase/FAD synthetase n=1 Tax=unclassified Commensalibacter TaxID=2630218 RepID=UPI0018DC9DC1|nr:MULTISPECIES: bifunctional riboflavin kinase/FAD synthetase [unclassified Commensalibacter]MBH9969332.1 bifunctional riboflavin kinase/FAD synthetase [Commensalibacter sp. M0265]MBH9976687.1 bifunctional riboflavin kinase/FAD synthetase [Commensalibacter sp. M0266]MBH9992376.1 bifunctional riboflavin kinase/FAD synthetase [Commensalibacter sp. M0270]MBI0045863.1 bifunctional riboflavin kinase/FAD synthetase [Commensalibacter sp. M0267]MBI0055532.1 bifunctional riboflavin kinase/FAD syntheta
MTTIYTNGQAIPLSAQGSVTALGNFDGVHRGHAYLLETLKKQFPDRSLSVVTFEPHPRQLFEGREISFRLTNAEERNAALSALGVANIFQITFDQEFAALDAKNFIHQILYKSFGIFHVACGEGFVFGHNRQGNTDFLISEADKLGIGVTIVKPLQEKGTVISSSLIRSCLKNGNPEKAAHYLGRIWCIQNIVEHGDKRGRTIGFPTANLQLGEQVEPKCGVYAIKIRLANGRMHEGVANLGYRPTIGKQTRACLEAHLFDFNQDIYGQKITVYLYHFIRDEKRFRDLNELKKQIARDANNAKEFFKIKNDSVNSL